MAETSKEKLEPVEQAPAEKKPEVTGEKAEERAKEAQEERVKGDKEHAEAQVKAEEAAKGAEETEKAQEELKSAQEIVEKYKDYTAEQLAQLPEAEKKQLEETKKILEEAQKKAQASAEEETEKEGWFGKILARATAALGAFVEALTKLFDRLLAKIGISLEGKEKAQEIIVKSPFGKDKKLKVTSWPGEREAPKTSQGEGSKNHDGIDIEAVKNTELFAGINGKIVKIGEDKEAGKYVKIELPDGRKLTYAHLNGTVGKEGDEVKPETKIGLTGNTGVSTAPHLHIGLETKDGVPINPLQLFAAYLENQPDEATREKITSYFEGKQKPVSTA